MLSTLPPNIICKIFDSTCSLTTATKLAQCSRGLNEIWAKHLASLNLVSSFDEDERWGRRPKFRFYAVTIARQKAVDKFENTNEAIKAGYKIAGIVNKTVAALCAELRGKCPSAKAQKVWDEWLEYILVKSLYMLWFEQLTGASMSDPEYYADDAAMVAYLLQPRWTQEAGYPSLADLRGRVRENPKPPVDELARLCVAVDARARKNRANVMLYEEGEEDSDDDDSLASYDDSDLDDLSSVDDGSEQDEGEFSDDEDEELVYHKGYADKD